MPYSAQVSPGRFSKKAEEIDRILSTPDVDLWRLRELALSEGGLVNDALRTRAWPKLLGVVDLRDNSEDGSSDHHHHHYQNPTTANGGAEDDNGHDSNIPFTPARAREDHSWICSSPANSERSNTQQEQHHPNGSADAYTPASTSSSARLSTFLENQKQSASTPNIRTTDAGSGWMKVQSAASPYDDESEEFSTASTTAFSTASTVSVFNTSHDDYRNHSSSPSPHKSRSSFRRRSTGGDRSLGVVARSLDAKQIELDVHRCTWHLLTGNQRTQRLQMEHKRNRRVAKLIRRKQRRLANLLNLTLLQSYIDAQDASDRLRYYQGYHDVACIFLSTLGGAAKAHPLLTNNNNDLDGNNSNHTHNSSRSNSAYVGLTVPSLGSSSPEALAAQLGIDLPAKLLVRVSQSHLRDYLKANFVELQTAIRLTVFPLLALLDPQVHEHLYEAQMEPFFALSWLITWFSHEIRDTELVKRLFDAFLVSHPTFPIYVAIAMCVHPVNRQEILKSECDFAVLHQLLRGLPRNSSMVGWKYRPGDGYVSDDEEDDDDDDDDSLMQTTSVDGDFAIIREELFKTQEVEEEQPAGAQSSVSTAGGSATEATARVPFQELIDLALVIVKRMPPRKLLNLSTRYYGEATVQEYLKQAPNMSLFADLPEWTVAPYADADTVLLQRVMAGESLSNTPREDPLTVARILREKQYSPAVVALGLGCAGMEAARRKRKRRRILVVAISIAVVAVAIGIAVHQQRRQQQQQKHLGPSASSSIAEATRKGLPSSSTVSTSTTVATTPQVIAEQRMEASPVETIKMEQSSPSEAKMTPGESSPTMIASSPIKLVPVQATQQVVQKMEDVKSSTTLRPSPPVPTTGRSGRSGTAPSADMAASGQHQMKPSWWMPSRTAGSSEEGTVGTPYVDTAISGMVQETKILPIPSTKSDTNVKVKGSRNAATDASQRLPRAAPTTVPSTKKNTSKTIISATMDTTQPARVVVHRTTHVSMGYRDSSSKVEAYGRGASRWASGGLRAVGRSLRDVGLFAFVFGPTGVGRGNNKPPIPPHCGSELSLEKPATVGLCFLELNQQLRNEWIHTQKLTRVGLSRLLTVVNRRIIQAWNHTKEVSIQKVGHAFEGAPEKLSAAVDKALNNVFPSSPIVVRNITQAVKEFEMERLVQNIVHFLKRVLEVLNRPLAEGLKLVVSWLNEPFKFK